MLDFDQRADPFSDLIPQQPRQPSGGYGRVVTGGPRLPPPRTPEQATIEQGRAGAAPYEAPLSQAELERRRQQVQQGRTGGVNFSDENSLRSQYQGLPPIRDYQAVAPIVNSALRAQPGGAGDLDIVYGFAKVMDPGSVVREGEVQMSQGTGSLGEQINGYVQSLRTGGRLPDSVRRRLIATIQNRADQYRSAYRQTRKQYWTNAERYGFSPEAIVGQDIDAAYEPGPNAPPGAMGASPPAGPQPQAGVIGSGVPQTGITTTDARESAHATHMALNPEAPATATEIARTRPSPSDIAYNRAWTEFVNTRPTREQADQWLRDNYGTFYLGAQPPTVDDANWRLIEESQRTGSGIMWRPRQSETIPEEEYQAEVARRTNLEAGERDRQAFAEQHPFLAGVDSTVRGAANAVTLGTADRLAGVLDGTGAAYQHGITNDDWRNRTIPTLGGSIAGGTVLPYGRTLPQQIVRGDVYGGVAGFQETDGDFGTRLRGAGQGAGVGGGMATVQGGVGRALMGNPVDRQMAIEAARRQGVYLPRYVSGGTGPRMAAGGIGMTPGRIPLEAGSQRFVDTLTTARDRAVGNMGAVLDRAGAGQRAQAGSRAFIRNSADRASQLEARIPIRAEQPAVVDNTRAALAEMTAGLSSNPQLSAIMEDRTLLAYREALQRGGLSWGDQRRFRSMIGERIGQPQVAGEATSQAALRRLYGAITQDMQATAASAGPRALTAFNRFNQYYRGREARREGIIQDILGRQGDQSAENAFEQINRWAQRDFRSTGRILRSMPREDADAVRASLFARMGMARPGQQTEIDGSTFSPSTFATQWQQIDERAKQFLIPSARHRRNLDDIALLTTRGRQAEGFANNSRTGLAVLTGNVLIGANSVWSHPFLTAIGVGGSMYAGRLLATPEGSGRLLSALRNPVLQQRMIRELQGEEGQDEANAPTTMNMPMMPQSR